VSGGPGRVCEEMETKMLEVAAAGGRKKSPVRSRQYVEEISETHNFELV